MNCDLYSFLESHGLTNDRCFPHQGGVLKAADCNALVNRKALQQLIEGVDVKCGHRFRLVIKCYFPRLKHGIPCNDPLDGMDTLLVSERSRIFDFHDEKLIHCYGLPTSLRNPGSMNIDTPGSRHLAWPVHGASSDSPRALSPCLSLVSCRLWWILK